MQRVVRRCPALGNLHSLGQDRHRAKKVGALLLQVIELLKPSFGLRLGDELPPDHKGPNQPGGPITEAVAMIGPIEHGERYLPEGRKTGLV